VTAAAAVDVRGMEKRYGDVAAVRDVTVALLHAADVDGGRGGHDSSSIVSR